MPLEEAVQQRQVAPDDPEVAVQEDLAMAQASTVRNSLGALAQMVV